MLTQPVNNITYVTLLRPRDSAPITKRMRAEYEILKDKLKEDASDGVRVLG
jgi:hypothetical protein